MKVAICTPVYRDPDYNYTASLAGVLLHPRNFDLTYFSIQGQPHCRARNALARRAMEWGADWLLWIDSDHDFPEDALERLLAWRLPFVGCNYARRQDPTGPTASAVVDGVPMPVWTTKEAAEAGKLQAVDGIGFGFCLAERRVFEAVGSPWFDREAEDFAFCAKAIGAGFRPHVDHRLSWQIGHVRTELVTNLHAMMDRDRYRIARNLR